MRPISRVGGGHGELWMEHPTEFFTPDRLAKQAYGPMCGSPFCFQFKRKNFHMHMHLHLSFFHNVVDGVTNSRAARFDDEHVQMFAAMRKSHHLFGTLRRNHWEMSLQSESWGWSQWSSFDSCCHIFGSLSKLLKDNSRHLASSQSSRLFKWQCGERRGKLLECQMWIPFLRHRSKCCFPKQTGMTANHQRR